MLRSSSQTRAASSERPDLRNHSRNSPSFSSRAAVGGHRRLAAAGAAGQEHRTGSGQDLVLLAAQLELELLAAGVEQALELLLAGEDGRVEEEPADAAGDSLARLRQHTFRRQQELEKRIGPLPLRG